jgi:uncharacterized repeat protein (TIGR03803 family)
MLSPNSDGSWTQTTLHNFGGPNDGDIPNGGLIMDQAGNLYGSTCAGGPYHAGTIYELSPAGSGQWAEKLVYPLNVGQVCTYNANTLAIDSAGNLYGMTFGGGSNHKGSVIQLSPRANGTWKETTLHNFGNNAGGVTDGTYPFGGVTLDASGNLYGTTRDGGTLGLGTVFKLAPVAGGIWKEIIIHNFEGEDGKFPYNGVTLDSAGNVYGTTWLGGQYGSGVVYQLKHVNGGWVRTVIHAFNAGGVDGGFPFDRVTLDAAGNVFGTTFGGGLNYVGIVFEFSPNSDGTFTSKILQNFGGGASGDHPVAGLAMDSAGNLYGTTSSGGIYGSGAAIEITP